MKLGKAIEISEDLLTTSPQFDPDLRRQAVKLGIEALKRHKNRARMTWAVKQGPLPGETEE